MRRSPTKLIVMTVGHSTRPVKKFIRPLKAHQVKRLVEERTVRVRGTIRSSTEANYRPPCTARLHYTYMPGLGGFADYMQMPEFREHLADLIRLAKSERIAITCAEAVRRPALSEARGYPIPFQYRKETDYD